MMQEKRISSSAMPVRRLLAAMAAAGMLGACAARPDIPDMAVDLPESWSTPPADATPALAAGDWWRQLNETQLDAIISAALADNPTLAQALARMEASRALARAAVGPLLPQVDGDAQAVYDRQLDGPAATATNGWRGVAQGGPSVTWEIDLFGRNRNALKAARANAAASAGDAQAMRISLIAAIVEAYVDLRTAQTRLTLVNRSVETQSLLARLVETRAKAGIASAFDLNRTRTGLNQALAQQPAAEEAAAFAAQRLATLAGRAEPDPAWRDPRPLPDLAAFALDTAPADLLRWRPDVRAAEARVRAASAEVGIARSELLPRLTLGGAITFADNLKGTPLPGASTTASLVPAISMPLFDWGTRLNLVRARQNDLVESIHGYRAVVLDAYAEAANAMTQVARQTERARSLAAAQTTAAAALSQSTALYDQGLTGLTERLDAETLALQTDLDALAARQSAAQAVIALHKALGAQPADL